MPQREREREGERESMRSRGSEGWCAHPRSPCATVWLFVCVLRTAQAD